MSFVMKVLKIFLFILGAEMGQRNGRKDVRILLVGER